MFNYFENIRNVLKTIDNPLKKSENLSKKEKLEKEFWDRQAENYLQNFDEDLFRYDENELFPPRHKYFYSLLENIQCKKILDICCGYGFTTVKCAKLGAYVTGIDISPKMIKLVKKNLEFNNVSEYVDLKLMSAEKMSFGSNLFDYVVGIGALHHLNLELAGKEILRVLKVGGKAIFLEPKLPFKWFMIFRSLIPIRCFESPGGGSLDDNDIYKFRRLFTDSEIHYFLFLRKIFRIPILRRFEFKSDEIDSFFINKSPISRKLCWAFVLESTK